VTRTIAAAAASVLLMLYCCACAAPRPADVGPGCALQVRPGVTVTSLRKLPKAIRAALAEAVGPMADRGAFFNDTDVVIKPAPFQRFIRAGKVGARWFVWFEHSGIAYWQQLTVFEEGPPPRVVSNAPVRGEDLCAATDRVMSSPAVPPDAAAH
jgi:hypothetical protein